MDGENPLEETPVAEGYPVVGTDQEGEPPAQEGPFAVRILAEELSEENASPAAGHNAVLRLQRFPAAGQSHSKQKLVSPHIDASHKTAGYMWRLQVYGMTPVNLSQGWVLFFPLC